MQEDVHRVRGGGVSSYHFNCINYNLSLSDSVDIPSIKLTVMLDMFCVVLAVVSAQALLGFTLGVPIPHFCISFEGLMIPKKKEEEGEKSKMAIHVAKLPSNLTVLLYI